MQLSYHAVESEQKILSKLMTLATNGEIYSHTLFQSIVIGIQIWCLHDNVYVQVIYKVSVVLLLHQYYTKYIYHVKFTHTLCFNDV